ncbi:MAG TPA: response regulator [Gemmatimonadaceae bacterium]|nr:response regulator [Gemmatimonadaceae bacterium]
MAEKSPLRVLIVDDEPLGRRRVAGLVKKETGVEIVGMIGDGAAAVDAIRSMSPDLVFLDVQMPGMSGLEVVRTIGPAQMPTVVFVTAYDKHALEAFDLAAIDYLVKPFDDDRFREAFQRARRKVRLEEANRLREMLVSVLEETGGGRREAGGERREAGGERREAGGGRRGSGEREAVCRAHSGGVAWEGALHRGVGYRLYRGEWTVRGAGCWGAQAPHSRSDAESGEPARPCSLFPHPSLGDRAARSR